MKTTHYVLAVGAIPIACWVCLLIPLLATIIPTFFTPSFSLSSYIDFFSDSFFRTIFYRSLRLSLLTTLITITSACLPRIISASEEKRPDASCFPDHVSPADQCSGTRLCLDQHPWTQWNHKPVLPQPWHHRRATQASLYRLCHCHRQRVPLSPRYDFHPYLRYGGNRGEVLEASYSLGCPPQKPSSDHHSPLVFRSPHSIRLGVLRNHQCIYPPRHCSVETRT